MRWHRTAVLSLVLVGALAAPVAAVTVGSIGDVGPDSVHADAIDWLVEHDISGGCAPELFCPNDAVSRAQLATFLQRLANAGIVDAATVEGMSASQLEGQIGPAGERGLTGLQGSTGSQGDVGLTGAQGVTGQDGNTILGLPGAPDAGLGRIGDLYLDIAAIDIYGPKDADGWGGPTTLIGADGVDGAPGAPGADGSDGRTWLTGKGAPDPTLGVDGDLYLDTTADAYYGPKTAGAWGDPTGLLGPQGEQGIQGT